MRYTLDGIETFISAPQLAKADSPILSTPSERTAVVRRWQRENIPLLITLTLPGTVIFIIDITFRYIALLGNLMQELLTAVSLRSVGRNDKKYNSVGGVMGVTFLRGTEMNKEMYEAMQCRGFTDDYEGL